MKERGARTSERTQKREALHPTDRYEQAPARTEVGGPPRVRTRRCAVGGLLTIAFVIGSAVHAQTPPPPAREPASTPLEQSKTAVPAPTTAPGTPENALPPSDAPAVATPEKPPINVNETVQKAREIIDGIDSNFADAPSRETLLELEKLIGDIQVADPAQPWLPYLLGRAYGLAGRNGDAIDQLRKFVQTRDGRNDWKAHQVLGDMFVGEFPRLAQGSYEKAAELNPNEPAVLTGLSNCANRAGNLDEGIRLARMAVEADGYKNVRYAHRLARALLGKQLFDEAEKEAMKALAIAEERVQMNPGKRVALQILMEQYSLLIELASARILASPTVDPAVYIRLTELTGVRADIANRLAKHDQVAILESAVSRSAPDTSVTLRLKYAAHLAMAGRTADAIAEYEKIIAAQPDNKEAAEALANLRAAKDGEKKPADP